MRYIPAGIWGNDAQGDRRIRAGTERPAGRGLQETGDPAGWPLPAMDIHTAEKTESAQPERTVSEPVWEKGSQAHDTGRAARRRT